MSAASSKIALLLPTLRFGGVQQTFLRLGGALQRLGREVEFVLCQAEGELQTETFVSTPARVLSAGGFRWGRTLRRLPALARYLRQTPPAALIAGLYTGNMIAVWARSLVKASVPLMITQHASPSAEFANKSNLYGRSLLQLARWSFPGADRIVAVSHGVAEEMHRYLAIPRERLDVIYNPVITNELLETLRTPIEHPYFQSSGPPVLTSVARLKDPKDFDTLIRATAEARTRREVRLIIVGDGPLRPRIERLIADLGQKEAISLVGYQPSPLAYVARSQGFILSSKSEALPTALIEALVCGAPVIATDCPNGPREILEGGRHGKLVPVGDPTAMARAIEEALDGRIEPPKPEAITRFQDLDVARRYLDILGL